MVLEKTLESPLDCKGIQPVHPKGDQSCVFIGRTHVETETPILWPPDAKSWFIWKDWTDLAMQVSLWVGQSIPQTAFEWCVELWKIWDEKKTMQLKIYRNSTLRTSWYRTWTIATFIFIVLMKCLYCKAFYKFK